MNTYSDSTVIEAKLPFKLNDNSIPSLENITHLQEDAARFINAYVGETHVDNDALCWIETDLVVTQILAIHDGISMPFQLKEEHKVILDSYRNEEFVDVVNLGFD